MSSVSRALGVLLVAMAAASAWRLGARSAGLARSAAPGGVDARGRERGTVPAAPQPAAVQDFGAAPDFALTDQEGRRVRRKDMEGRPWAAAFIFTSCRGQCPVMTRRMGALAQRLPGVRFVSFSVDPSDRPADLKRFARAYGAGWTFLTGAQGEVKRLSREGFKLGAETGGGPEEPILHSNRLLLIDGAGRIRGTFDATDPDALARFAAAAASL